MGEDDDQVAGDRGAAHVRAAFEHFPHALVVLTGPDHVITAANAAYRALVGREAIVGRTVLDVAPEMEGQHAMHIFDRVRATGEPQQLREWRGGVAPQRPAAARRLPGG